MKKYNWAIVGTGWAASDMADALNKENGEIYAVVNPHEEHADQFAEKYQVKKTYYDYAAMLADPNVDIVYIATPHTFHYEQIKQALNADKHVFCEKAITVNAAQFDEVERLARSKNLILTEGFTLYHMPIYRKVKQLIVDGKLGEIKMVQVNFGSLKNDDPTQRFFSKDLAGGALLDIGGYATAFVRMFLDKPHVAETSVKFFETGVDEMSGIILKNAKEQMGVSAFHFGLNSLNAALFLEPRAMLKSTTIRGQRKQKLHTLMMPILLKLTKSVQGKLMRHCNMKCAICNATLNRDTMMVN